MTCNVSGNLPTACLSVQSSIQLNGVNMMCTFQVTGVSLFDSFSVRFFPLCVCSNANINLNFNQFQRELKSSILISWYHTILNFRFMLSMAIKNDVPWSNNVYIFIPLTNIYKEQSSKRWMKENKSWRKQNGTIESMRMGNWIKFSVQISSESDSDG